MHKSLTDLVIEYYYEPKPAHPLDPLSLRGVWDIVYSTVETRKFNKNYNETVIKHYIRERGL